MHLSDDAALKNYTTKSLCIKLKRDITKHCMCSRSLAWLLRCCLFKSNNTYTTESKLTLRTASSCSRRSRSFSFCNFCSSWRINCSCAGCELEVAAGGRFTTDWEVLDGPDGGRCCVVAATDVPATTGFCAAGLCCSADAPLPRTFVALTGTHFCMCFATHKDAYSFQLLAFFTAVTFEMLHFYHKPAYSFTTFLTTRVQSMTYSEQIMQTKQY